MANLSPSSLVDDFQNFWGAELAAAPETLWKLTGVVTLYVVGRFIIEFTSRRLARAILYGTSRFGFTRHEGSEARLQTLFGLIRSVGLYALFFVCAILLLRALNFDAVSVVTSASVASVAFGFGAQKLVKDVISGFFIILENQYAVGDYVTINGIVTGRVEELGMRILRLRDDSGRLYIFANGDIAQVCNQSRGPITSVVEIGLPIGSDASEARKAIDEAGKELFESEHDLGLADAPAYQGLGAGDPAHIVLRILVKISDPTKVAAAGVAIRNAVHARLADKGISSF